MESKGKTIFVFPFYCLKLYLKMRLYYLQDFYDNKSDLDLFNIYSHYQYRCQN